MKKLKIFENSTDDLTLFLNTNEYTGLTSLKRNMVYSYIMIETRTKGISQLASQFDISTGLLKEWAKYGRDLYKEITRQPDIIFQPQNALL